MEALKALLPLLLIMMLAYVMLIIPARRQRARIKELHARLRVGDEVLMQAGVIGKVRSIDGDMITLELAPEVVTRWGKNAVAGIIKPSGAADGQPLADPGETVTEAASKVSA